MSEGVKLTPREQQALTAWETAREDFALSFNGVAELSGLPRDQVRRTVRALARKGLAVYVRGLWTEDGRPGGSGYALTPAGLAALQEAEDAR